jgi:polysaccharide export outer membrane protein
MAENVYKKSDADLTPRNSLIERKDSKQLDRINVEEKIKLVKSYARFIGGAVGTPGSYPAANTISLSQLIAVAGGLTADANLHEVSVTKLKIEEGRIVSDKVENFDLNRTPGDQILLSGMYNVLIPPFINDATTGVVTIEGEVERPGQYVIGRDETLHDLIDRAGGFTTVAYPLGAIFTRENLKAAQQEGNDVLARQVEEAVLKISQSENKQGVGEQITAVLGYAKQLRQQKVSGRLTVNVLQNNKSAPVYLQDGDILTIPKRPGHVSVIGSVQKNTVASYSESKRLSSYLASAGGTNRIADRTLTYIVLPNGESDSVTNDSIIPPGSVIVVPPKTHSLSPLNFTETVSRILGNIALSFLAINNAR